MTHEHFWEIGIVRYERGLWDITGRDRSIGSDWSGKAGYVLVDSRERLLEEVARLIDTPPPCRCRPEEPRYHVVTPDGNAWEQPAGSMFEYYAIDHSIAFTGPTGIIERRYPRGSWQSVVFK